MGHDCCSKKKGGCSKSSSAPAASSEASRYEAAPGPSREPAEASVCDVCSFPGPCPDQGLCMDPTVIQSDADSSLIYVIEGQAYSRNDSRWETKALPSQTPVECCVNGTPVSRAEYEEIGLDVGHRHGPNCGHDRIPHGDHFDYLVGSHLHHVPETCEKNLLHHHGNGQALDHGEVIVVRKRCGEHGHKYEPLHSTRQALNESEKAAIAEEIGIAVAIEHGENQDSVHTRLLVEGICCPSEVPLIRKILGRIPGVRKIEVIVPMKIVLVDHVPQVADVGTLVDALNRASLCASIAKDGTATANSKEGNAGVFKWITSNAPPLNVIASTIFFAISFLSFVVPWNHFKLTTCLICVVIGLPPIIMKAFGALMNRILDINTLMVMATIGSMAMGEYGEGATIVVLFSFSEWLTNKSFHKAQNTMAALLALKPESALLKSSMKEVAIESVKVGEVVIVKPGCKVPLDGTVVEGKSTVDESALTGESVPVEKEVGSQVLAGTLNLSGYLEMRVGATSSDSTVSRHARLVEEAQASRSRAELVIEKFAKIYTPIVVALAFFTPGIACLVQYKCEDAIGLALVFLVIACPCALVLSTPVVAVCALARAARKGVLIKGSTHLETLGKLQTLCFDKTGTLTEGRFRITGCRLSHVGGEDRTGGGQGGPALGEGALLRWTCAVEKHSSHPIASAILEKAGPNIRVAAERSTVTGYSTIQGEGVTANVDGRYVEVGNSKIAERNGWIEKDPETAMQAALWEQRGATVIWVGVDGQLAGIIAAQDRLRDKATNAISGIKAKNIRPVIVTGDNAGAAKIAARNLGIASADVHAGLSPEDKLRILKEYKHPQPEKSTQDLEKGGLLAKEETLKSFVTGMVGDGINDGPALAISDVGIAMGVAGTAVAMETADVALLTNDLTQLVNVIDLARVCVQKIRQNIAFSVASKIVVISLSIAGLTGLLVAVLFDICTAMVVVLNGMSLLRKERANNHCANKERKKDRQRVGRAKKDDLTTVSNEAMMESDIEIESLIKAHKHGSCCGAGKKGKCGSGNDNESESLIKAHEHESSCSTEGPKVSGGGCCGSKSKCNGNSSNDSNSDSSNTNCTSSSGSGNKCHSGDSPRQDIDSNKGEGGDGGCCGSNHHHSHPKKKKCCGGSGHAHTTAALAAERCSASPRAEASSENELCCNNPDDLCYSGIVSRDDAKPTSQRRPGCRDRECDNI